MRPAFVKIGTFILSDEHLVKIGDRNYCKIVGYIPVGTVVYHDPDKSKKVLFNKKKARYETYIFVESDIGISGLLLEDIKVEIEQPVLIPVSNNIIPIQTSNSTKTDPKNLSAYSRSDGEFLVVLDDKDPDFYDVELPWTGTNDRTPDKGKLFKRYVEDGDVLHISPDTVKTQHPRIYNLTGTSKTIGLAEDDYLLTLAHKIKNRVNEKAEDIYQFLKNLDALKCLVSTKGNIDIGVKVFGTGLGLSFAVDLKEKDRFYDFGTRIYYLGTQEYLKFITVKVIHCQDHIPYRAALFLLQKADLTTVKRVSVWAKDIDRNLNLSHCPSISKDDAARHMFSITGYESYHRALTFLETMAEQGGGYLSELNPYDCRVVLNIILSELAYFSNPKIGS
jgi:hypothetical protein